MTEAEAIQANQVGLPAEVLDMEDALALKLMQVVEDAAIAAARTMGKGERKDSDRVAVEAMRRAFDKLPIDGRIVIGGEDGSVYCFGTK